MSIQKRPDGRWRARIYVDGKERAKHFIRKADATRWEADQLAAKHRGSWVDPSNRTTVAEYAVAWAAQRPYRPSTRKSVEWRIRGHIEGTKLGGTRLVQLRPSQAQAWATERAQVLAPLTVRNVVGLLKSMLDDAVADRIIGSNPVVRISTPSTERKRVEVVTPAQVQSLQDTIGPRNKVMILLLATSGLRLGELLGLRVQDIDFLHRCVRVDWQFASNEKVRTKPKTPASERTVPLPSVTLTALSWHIATFGPGDDGALFTNGKGTAYGHDHFGVLFKRAVRRAPGVPDWLTPHGLRHFYASQLLEAGESPATVAERLGHKNAGVTLSTYAHFIRKDPDATRKAMDALFGSDFSAGLGPDPDQDRLTGS